MPPDQAREPRRVGRVLVGLIYQGDLPSAPRVTKVVGFAGFELGHVGY